MKTSDKGINLIKKYEGFVPTAYRCSADKWTIGYGHTQNVKPTDVITLDEAERFFKQDIEFAEKEVNRHNLDINQNQFDALVSFVFNLGGGSFARSTLLKKIKSNPNDPTIRKEFERWIYAGGRALKGLARRREEEANLYFTK